MKNSWFFQYQRISVSILCCLLDLFQFHFIKTDFNRWKDEDDTDDEEKEDFSLDDVSVADSYWLIADDCDKFSF